jgi:hypothetical protein
LTALGAGQLLVEDSNCIAVALQPRKWLVDHALCMLATAWIGLQLGDYATACFLEPLQRFSAMSPLQS